MKEITYNKVKSLIESVIEIGGELTLRYLPMSKIETAEDCGSLYYSGANKIEITSDSESVCFRIGGQFVYLEKGEDPEPYIKQVYDALDNDIWGYVHTALGNLGYESEELKYFDDNDDPNYIEFITEVRRLMTHKLREVTLTEILP